MYDTSSLQSRPKGTTLHSLKRVTCNPAPDICPRNVSPLQACQE